MKQSSPEMLRSFGRRHGRKLRANRAAMVETLLPKLLINLPPENLFKDTTRPLWFEIGFGGGEHLAEQARLHPEVNFIGCEPYVNGMATLLSAIERERLANIRLYDNDARLLLGELSDNSIERMFILFPDPWPKVRHHKKRIISQGSLPLFHRKLKAGGLLRIATDHEDYCTWILENLLAYGKFSWQAKSQVDWHTPPENWVTTRYQAKAAAEGRKAVFLDWIKH